MLILYQEVSDLTEQERAEVAAELREAEARYNRLSAKLEGALSRCEALEDTLDGLRALRTMRFEAAEDPVPARFSIVAEAEDGMLYDDEAYVGPWVAGGLLWTLEEARQWIEEFQKNRPSEEGVGLVVYRIVEEGDSEERFF